MLTRYAMTVDGLEPAENGEFVRYTELTALRERLRDETKRVTDGVAALTSLVETGVEVSIVNTDDGVIVQCGRDWIKYNHTDAKGKQIDIGGSISDALRCVLGKAKGTTDGI